MFDQYIAEFYQKQQTLDALQHQAEQGKPGILDFLSREVPEFYQKFETELANAEPTYLNTKPTEYFGEPGLLLGGLVFTLVHETDGEKLVVSSRYEHSDEVLDTLIIGLPSRHTPDSWLVNILRRYRAGHYYA